MTPTQKHGLFPMCAVLLGAVALLACEEHAVEVIGHPPEILGFFALPTETRPGGEVKVTVDARDLDGDPIEYLWSASGGRLEGDSATVTWWAPFQPADSVYALGVRVSDNRHGSASASLEVFVVEDAEGEPCTVPCDQIIRVGPARCDDCIGLPSIPALTEPLFVGADDPAADYLTDESMVIGIRSGDDVRAYPVLILNRHEVVNDIIGTEQLAITYCPFTASALVFRRQVGPAVFDFDVSGFLFNSNLILYDLGGRTLWSQMRLEAVRGRFLGRKLEPVPAFFMTWKAWRTLFPQTRVLSKETGYGKNYEVDEYAAYNRSTSIWAPVSHIDGRVPVKERVLGVIVNNEPVAYAFGRLGEKGVLREVVGGVEVLVVWHTPSLYAVAFSPQTSAGFSDFVQETSEQSFPFFLRDQLTGTRWDLTGQAIEGPLVGETLTQVQPSYPAFWFAWAAFWPETLLRDEL